MTKLSFTAIVTAHAQDPSKILGNLLYQTRKPDEILCYCSDVEELERLERDFQTVKFLRVMNHNDWGHAKRADGVLLASGDALGFFNADDSYDLSYVEKMMCRIEDGADAVYCAWNAQPDCVFARGSSTSGNFIVRTGLARAVGYADRKYDADGKFIDAIRENSHLISRVNDLLYFHNVQ